MADKLTRIAVVNKERCRPKKCSQECKRGCPVVRMGKMCIQVSKKDKIAKLSETLCIGCGICVKKCPFKAIQIINLPKNLDKDTTHRYNANSFKLHRLPTPRPGQVLGLVGVNGIGKSTALKILAGKLKPNLGDYNDAPAWEEVIAFFRGSELQNYFTRLLEDDIKAIIKPQYVDSIPRVVKGTVGQMMLRKDDRGVKETVMKQLDLEHLFGARIGDLSGGELQRFAIATVMVQDAEMYMFDEPSSYLDVKQRLRASLAIRSLCTNSNYVLCVEHDLSILDYLSDFICVLYGTPGAYGVVTLPYSVREGINAFLAGFIPTENLRFRPYALSFKITTEDDVTKGGRHKDSKYPALVKTLRRNGEKFVLNVEKGGFSNSEILVLLGENGTGKTTLIRMLAGLKNAGPDDETIQLPPMQVSYKPQKISPTFPGTVEDLLNTRLKGAYRHPQFQTDVFKPLEMEELMDQEVKKLSGGQLQRVALTLALGKNANVYLIDEPSAYLDSEQRLFSAKVIKRFIMHAKKTAFVVEHDFIMATYLADRVILFTGEPHKEATAHSPQPLIAGMNSFLKLLDITFRRDSENWRPRINKKGSVKDEEQKRRGTYFFVDEDADKM